MQRRLSKTVTLDKNLVRVVKELAEQKERSFSMQIEKLIEQALLLKIDI